jgi:hypothetical protein
MAGRVFAIDDKEPLAAQLAPFAAEGVGNLSIHDIRGADVVTSARRAWQGSPHDAVTSNNIAQTIGQ